MSKILDTFCENMEMLTVGAGSGTARGGGGSRQVGRGVCMCMTGWRVVNAVGRGANARGGEARAARCWGADVVEERRRLRSMKRGHASRTPPQPAAYTHC